MTQRIVINNCFGGFGLSHKAFLRLRELGQKDALAETDFGEPWTDSGDVGSFCNDIARDDPMLIQIIAELNDFANGDCARLKIVEIPNGIQWQIEEYYGAEWIAERHRIWT